jgi:hypothetical protein
MSTYFDAALDADMRPMFNGTPEEVEKWLREHPDAHVEKVCVGKTLELLHTTEYMSRGLKK